MAGGVNPIKGHHLARMAAPLAFMALIFYFSALPGPEVMRAAEPLASGAASQAGPYKIKWLKVGHLIGYFGLGASLVWALRPFTRHPAVAAPALAALYAATDELHQSFVPGRHAGLEDVLLDACAATLPVLVWLLVRAHRQPGK